MHFGSETTRYERTSDWILDAHARRYARSGRVHEELHVPQPTVRPVLADDPRRVVRREDEAGNGRGARPRRRSRVARETAPSRREFLGDAARVAAGGALATVARPLERAHAARANAGRSVAIVGAGMAGLACADRLRESRILATVYEAAPERVGGRVRSIADTFPGRTIELGGEFIDYWHTAILKYVRRFDLTRIDLFDTTEEVLYRIDGVTYPESTIIDAFRDVVQRMKKDMRAVTSGISARNFDPAPNSADRRLDNTNLQEYSSRSARPTCSSTRFSRCSAASTDRRSTCRVV